MSSWFRRAVVGRVDPDDRLSVVEHLTELRKRLFIGAITLAVAFGVLYVFNEWLLGFAGNDFEVALRANEYFSFALTLMFAGGLVFEVPVAMLVLARLGLVTAEQFRKGWRVAIVVIALIAAILPGGDPVSMLLLMVPQILLYAVGIWLAAVFGRPAPWAQDRQSPAATETPV